MKRNALLLIAATAATLLSMHVSASIATAKVQSFRSASEQRGIVTFNIRGLDARRVRSASLMAPRRKTLKIDRRKVQRAAQRGVLRIKLPQRWLRTNSRTEGGIVRAAPHSRGRHKLKVVTGVTPTTPKVVTDVTPTTPVGTPILSDTAAAARVQRSGFEPRPGNAQANRRVPTAIELRFFVTFSPNWGPCAEKFKRRITGNFTGTTDELIQWAAHKWGIDEDIIHAVAISESYWNQDTRGDWDDRLRGYHSYGLMQVRRNSWGESAPNWDGTFPLSRDSTAFNLDFWGASMRQYYEGCSTWLNEVERGRDYAAGDIWGSVGAWFSGRWYNGDPNVEYSGANWYIRRIKANRANRVWEQPGF